VAILGLDFGRALQSKRPWADSNYHLAKAVVRVQRDREKLGFPPAMVILQAEISDAYATLDLSDIGGDWLKISTHNRHPGRYLDSYEVIRQAKDAMKIKGLRNLIIVAHPDHYDRCRTIAKWFGLQVLEVNRNSLKQIPYDKESDQLWTRNRHFFRTWTILGYVSFWLKRRKKDRC